MSITRDNRGFCIARMPRAIDDQVVITERSCPVGQHRVRIARIADFPGGEDIASGTLSLLILTTLPVFAAATSRSVWRHRKPKYLQHVDVFGGDRSLFRNCGYRSLPARRIAPDVGQQFQRLFHRRSR